MTEEQVSLRATIRGRVQGVYFRDFVRAHAQRLNLTGYARNLPDGAFVEVFAEGERHALEELLRHLRQGPPRARVDTITNDWGRFEGKFTGFAIR